MFRAYIADRSSGSVRVTTVPRWAIGLGAVGIGIVGFLVLLLGAGLALLLAPVAIGALLVARWRLKRMVSEIVEQSGRQGGRMGQAGDPGVIDAEYRVVRDDRPV